MSGDESEFNVQGPGSPVHELAGALRAIRRRHELAAKLGLGPSQIKICPSCNVFAFIVWPQELAPVVGAWRPLCPRCRRHR